MEVVRGQIVDRYTVETILGRGGMATVYRVRHNALDSAHALKVLHVGGPSVRERLVLEGRVQAALRHPNVLAVTDVLDVDGAPGLVMELVEGPSLDAWLARQRPSLAEAEAIFDGILAGVARAHAHGLVHRDLKPANVLIEVVDGRLVPKVADFGLAKALNEGGELHRTRSGMPMGTPAYMAPEQVRDAKGVDARADIWSLGCILYELVTGRRPFGGDDVMGIFNAVIAGRYAPPLVPGLPDRLVRAIEGCLVVDPDARIPHCEALRAALRGEATRAPVSVVSPVGVMHTLPPADSSHTLPPPEPAVPRSWRPAAAGIAVMAAAIVAAVVWSAPGEEPVPGEPPPATAAPAPQPPPVEALPPGAPTTLAAPASSRPSSRTRVTTTVVPATPSATSAPVAREDATAASVAPATGSFSTTGDARAVFLESATGRYRAGEEIPAGIYRVSALFEGGRFVDAGAASIIPGGTTQVHCQRDFTTCSEKP